MGCLGAMEKGSGCVWICGGRLRHVLLCRAKGWGAGERQLEV